MSKRKILELCLDRVELVAAGGGRGRGNTHIVFARLIWPRPAIAEKISVKPLEFERNAVDLKDSSWTERILFKETIQGTCGLEISVSERVSIGQADRLVTFIGASILKMAESEAGSVMVGPLGAGLVRMPFQYLGKLANSSKKTPRMLGVGTIDLSFCRKSRSEHSIEIPLVSPRTVYRTTRTVKHGETSAKRRTLLKAGAPNGVVMLTAGIYE